MSINVTVRGNPISIERGKMVTGGGDSEFALRRRLRLQQVRQQSKEIAADVRNRVRKEKEKQLSKVEQKGENDLKRWQTRKLLKLQQQYEDCLKEIGSAHKNAALEPDPCKELKQISSRNITEAEIRGKKAAERKKNQDKQKELELNEHIERKKVVKQVENTRSALVANVRLDNSPPKRKKNKRKKTSPDVSLRNDMANFLSESLVSNRENVSANTPKRKKEAQKKKNSKMKLIKKKIENEKNIGVPETNSVEINIFSPEPRCLENYTCSESSQSPNKNEAEIETDLECIPCKRKTKVVPVSLPEPSFSEQSALDTDNLQSPMYHTDIGLIPLDKRNNEEPENIIQISDKMTTEINRSSPVQSYSKPSTSKFQCIQRKSKSKSESSPVYARITKVSDRIRERQFSLPNEEYVEENVENVDTDMIKCLCCTNPQCCIQEEAYIQEARFADGDKFTQTQECKKVNKSTHRPELQVNNYKIVEIPSEQLPFVPTTTLGMETSTSQPSKVKYYDHLNRFSKEYEAQPVIQKIDKDSIEVHPSIEGLEQAEMLKVMQERDKRAHDRGVRAMEKQKIQNDYKQLLEELPVLQRQERLASMRTHKPSFHMHEDRLQELERRRQVRIENIFEKYYQKAKILETPLITIRPVQKLPPSDELKLPFKALDITEESLGKLNVGEWKNGDNSSDIEKVDASQAFQNEFESSEECVQYKQKSQKQDKNKKMNRVKKANMSDEETSEKVDDSNVQNKQKALVDLLQRVNKQRELLLKEVSSLPSSSNLQNMLQDDDIIKFTSQKINSENNTLKNKNLVSTGTSPLAVLLPSKSKIQGIVGKERKEGSSSSSSSDFKKKKSKKIKTKKQKIIKNECTQTSPSTVSVDQKKPQPTTMDSKEDAKKLCEIIINMNKNSDVQVCKSSDQTQSGKKSIILNLCKSTKVSISSPTNGNDLSSSTTYLSLPEEQKQSLISKSKTSTKSQEHSDFKDLLRQKPQQTNIDKTDNSKIQTCPGCVKTSEEKQKEITPQLLKYIKKLLCMSRQSIDELTVSSSDVSTPGTSIMETSENCNPFAQLQTVMQHFNLNIDDIQKLLDSSVIDSTNSHSERDVKPETDTQTAFTNNKKPVSETCFNEVKDLQKPSTSKQMKDSSSADKIQKSSQTYSPKTSPKNSSSQNSKCSSPQKSNSSSNDYEDYHINIATQVKQRFGLTSEDMEDIPYANIVSRYKLLTKTCCDKITKLTEMIDNVRLEKERILSPDGSDKYETSVTSYLDLPKTNNVSVRNDKSDNNINYLCDGSCTDTSMSQDAVDKYLLSISGQNSPTNKKEPDYDTDERPVNDKNNKNSSNKNFVPMLQGIPKYQKDNTYQTDYFINSSMKQFIQNTRSKPPPTLLRNVTKYNLNIDMTPHELSTIVELDTLISSRNVSEVVLPRAKTPEENVINEDESFRSKNDKEASAYITLTPDYLKTSPSKSKSPKSSNFKLKLKDNLTSKKTSSKISPQSSSPSDENLQSNNIELSGIQPLMSEKSESSAEDMEGILRNMGLGWAVSTLKKTQEALALSSSSSSFEASYKKRVSFKEFSNSSSSNSEVSLKKVLNKELIQKISSSSLSNSSEINQPFQDFQDISEIRDSSTANKDASHQRTSTPVQQSKSTDSRKDLFTGDSDISSVRLHSEENLYLSIPNVSLDTNKSLSKSK